SVEWRHAKCIHVSLFTCHCTSCTGNLSLMALPPGRVSIPTELDRRTVRGSSSACKDHHHADQHRATSPRAPCHAGADLPCLPESRRDGQVAPALRLHL